MSIQICEGCKFKTTKNGFGGAKSHLCNHPKSLAGNTADNGRSYPMTCAAARDGAKRFKRMSIAVAGFCGPMATFFEPESSK